MLAHTSSLSVPARSGMRVTVVRLALSAALLSSVSMAPAHACSTDLEQVTTMFWPDTTFGTAGSFTRMVAGDISGDGMPDAIGMAGNQVVFFENVGVHTALTLVPRVANDIDIAHGAAPNGHDSLVLVNSTGLEVLYLSHPTLPAEEAFLASTVVTGDWAGALKVRSADIDGDGGADYVGVAADGRTLLCRLDGEDLIPTTLQRGVLDLALLRWTEHEPLRIAVLTSLGVSVYNTEWTAVDTFGHGGTPGGVIAVLKGAAVDKIAWVKESTGGPQAVVTLAEGGSVVTGSSMPAAKHVVAIASGDVDGDDVPDLVISHTHDCLPYFWSGVNDFNDDPEPLLDDSPLSTVSGSTNHALPLVADVDLDHEVDVIVAVQPHASYAVFLHDIPPPSELPRSLDLSSIVLTDSFYQYDSAFYLDASATHRTLRVAFRFDTFPAEANTVELVVWKQIGGPSGSMENTSFDHEIYTPWSPSMSAVVAGAQSTYDRETDDSGNCFQTSYWIEMRAAKQDGNDLTVVGPTYVAALVPSLEWIDIVRAGSPVWLWMNATPVCGTSSLQQGPGSGHQRAPALIPKRRVPDFGPNVVPTLKAIPPNQEPWTLLDIYADFE